MKQALSQRSRKRMDKEAANYMNIQMGYSAPTPPKVLHLTLKKKWFDMIASGEKKEEYREIGDFWCRRFCQKGWEAFEVEILHNAIDKHYDIVHVYNGGSPCLKYPNFQIECKGITVGKAKPEWSDNWQGEVFIIKLGRIITP